MATFDVDLTKGEGYGIEWPSHRIGVMRRRVDFTTVANYLAQNKVMSLFKIPADVIVLKCGMYVVTAQTAVTDVDLGLFTQASDGGTISAISSVGYGEAESLAVLGYVVQPLAALYNVGGGDPLHVVAANSVIALTNDQSTTISTAVVDFYIVVLDVSKPLNVVAGQSGSYST